MDNRGLHTNFIPNTRNTRMKYLKMITFILTHWTMLMCIALTSLDIGYGEVSPYTVLFVFWFSLSVLSTYNMGAARAWKEGADIWKEMVEITKSLTEIAKLGRKTAEIALNKKSK